MPLHVEISRTEHIYYRPDAIPVTNQQCQSTDRNIHSQILASYTVER